MSAAGPCRLEEAVLEAVREAGRQGRPATREMVCAALVEQGLAAAGPEDADRIGAVLDAHPGIASFAGLDGAPLYHDPAELSGAYARILDRKASPLALLAGEIRLNSRDYLRPVAVELFEAPPFELTPEAIRQALQAMAASPEYGDITFTTTSSGAVYLFSTLAPERNYATFLAEHAEGLAMNP